MRAIPLKSANKSDIDDWLTKSKRLFNELKKETDPKKRRVLIRQNQKHWRDPDLLNFLERLSDGKCWFTETEFKPTEYQHLEHFRPKSCVRDETGKRCEHDGYWWLAFDIDNYRLSKPVPNVKKGTYFPLKRRCDAILEPGRAVSREKPFLLDPIDVTDVTLLSFNKLGQPQSNINRPGGINEWSQTRVDFTIERLGLDNKKLCDKRKAVWIAINSLLSEYEQKITFAEEQECDVSKGEAVRILLELSAYLAPTQEFTRVVSLCFDENPIGRELLPTLIQLQREAA